MTSLKKFGIIAASALMMCAVGATMTACGGSVGQVNAKTIAYDGAKITWDEAKNADAYLVRINDGSEKRVSTTSFTYKAKSAENEVVVTISALKESKKGDDKEGKASSRTFTRLETIQKSSITFDAGVMSWNDVANADSYLLSYSSSEAPITVFGTTYGDDATRQFPTGKQLTIKVKPNSTDGSTFADWSESISKAYIAPVTGVKYDGDTIQWNSVEFAQKYKLTIAGEAEPIIVNQNKYTYPGRAEDVTVNIEAMNDSEDIFNSVMPEPKTFVYLPKITGLEVKEGMLTWPKIDKAETYEVRVDGLVKAVTADTFYQMPTNKSVRVDVKPLLSTEDVFFSIRSDELQAYVLTAPTLKWNQAATLENGEEARPIGWSGVSGSVGGYMVKIITPAGTEDLLPNLNANAMDFPYLFNEAGGTYTVSVAAKGGALDVYDSAWSKPIVVERLAAPTSPKITSDASTNSWFEVEWAPVTGASGYYLIREGQKISVSGNSKRVTDPIDKNDTAGMTINYLIQSRGVDYEPVTGGGGRVTLSSIIPKDDSGLTVDVCKFEIISRATPTDIVCTEGNWDMTWTGVTTDTGYYVYDKDSQVGSSMTEKFDLHELECGMDYTFSIAAAGNGSNILASNRNGGTKNVRRLAVPYNLSISESSTFNPTLEWQSVDSVNSFSLIVNGTTVSTNVSVGANIADEYITTQGMRFSVMANGLYEDGQGKFLVSSNPCEARTFGRLVAPTFSDVKVNANRELQWTAPTNFASIGDPFTYTVYNEEQDAVWTGETQTTVSIDKLAGKGFDKLPAGEHTFYVRAIGSGGCINSKFSDTATFTVLKTPTIEIKDGKYTWKNVGMSQYELTIGDTTLTNVTYSEENERYEHVPTTEITEYKENGYGIKLVAIGDGGRSYVDSQPFTMTQFVKRAALPSFTFSYEDEEGNALTRYQANSYLKVNVSQAVSYTNGYTFTLGETAYVSKADEGLTYKTKLDSATAFQVKVSSNGGTFDENNNFYLPTAVQQVNGGAKWVWIHHAVTNLDSNAQTYQYTWVYQPAEAIKDIKTKPTNGFTVIITYSDNTTETIEASKRSVDVEKFTQVTKVEVFVNPCTDGEIFEIGSESAVKAK